MNSLKRRIKFWRDRRRVERIINEIIKKEGEPENEEEAAKIFTRAWKRLGYKVRDARTEIARRFGEEEQ